MKIKPYDLLFWIFFVIAIIFFIWYVFGDSPTLEQGLLILIITFLFKIQTSVISNNIKINSLEKKFNNLENSFIHLANDFKEHIKPK